MNYETTILSKNALVMIHNYLMDNPSFLKEDLDEIKRALRNIDDRIVLENNRINQVPMPKGTEVIPGLRR